MGIKYTKNEPYGNRYPAYPILRGFVEGESITVYCPYCNAWHTHSWDGVPSHRVEHCHNVKSGFKDGYYVATYTKEDMRDMMDSFKKALETKLKCRVGHRGGD